MTAKAPPSASLVAQSLTPPESSLTTVSDTDLLVPPPQPSWKETLIGTDGSYRRDVSFWLTGMVVATAVRMACFSPLILGNYLLQNLGPVERESVGWSWIVAVRAIDLALGAWIWKRVDGQTRKDGALFGAMIAGISRVSLYAFEHAYFLLSTETMATILTMDVVSLASAFFLLPTFFPHSLPTRPGLTAYQRVTQNPELFANVILACGLATTLGALASYGIEHLGGMAFVKQACYEVEVPSILSSETMTPSEMMATPIVSIPSLRSFLKPGTMRVHLGHAFLEAILLVPFASILPSLSAPVLGALVAALILPTSALLLWDVLPISLIGAAAVSATLALRAGIMTTIVGWVLEELRMTVHQEHVTMVLVDQKSGDVGVVEADVLVADEKVEERSRL